MAKSGKWEEEQGAAYRASFKKSTYDIVNVQLRKDGADGLTKAAVQEAAARRGMNVAEYIKALIRKDMGV